MRRRRCLEAIIITTGVVKVLLLLFLEEAKLVTFGGWFPLEEKQKKNGGFYTFTTGTQWLLLPYGKIFFVSKKIDGLHKSVGSILRDKMNG